MPRLRLAVLVSGRGTNLQSLLAASRDGRMDADVVLVISNRAGVGALDIAERASVPRRVMESKGRDREEHEREMIRAIDEAQPDLVILAGYMRILTPHFIRHYAGRLLNIHPSLLPAFPGLDAAEQAHERDVRIAGCTTHFVTEQVDSGPIVLQAAVAVPPGATPEELRARILEAEHRIYPMTIHLLATGRARLEAGRVVFRDLAPTPAIILIGPGGAP